MAETDFNDLHRVVACTMVLALSPLAYAVGMASTIHIGQRTGARGNKVSPASNDEVTTPQFSFSSVPGGTRARSFLAGMRGGTAPEFKFP